MKFTRHAQRCCKLNGIPAESVAAVLAEPGATVIYTDGTRVAIASVGDRFGGLPLKVVFAIDAGKPIIITGFPFKGRRGEPEDAH